MKSRCRRYSPDFFTRDAFGETHHRVNENSETILPLAKRIPLPPARHLCVRAPTDRSFVPAVALFGFVQAAPFDEPIEVRIAGSARSSVSRR
jgi:hypothetical protein